jgi:type III restriction enzyme
VLKDKYGRIHLFEVKSVNVSNAAQFDSQEYKTKILALKECYKRCSELTEYYYYLPVLKDDIWQITRIAGGNEEVMTKETFVKSLG